MIKNTKVSTNDGLEFNTYGVKGSNKLYSYDYSDISQNKDEAELLDLILSSGYIKESDADSFIAHYINYIANK